MQLWRTDLVQISAPSSRTGEAQDEINAAVDQGHRGTLTAWNSSSTHCGCAISPSTVTTLTLYLDCNSLLALLAASRLELNPAA